jgi:hypothetical protein
MTNKFCRYIGGQYRIDAGMAAPCCWFTKEVDINNTVQFKEYEQWLSTIDDWVPECNHCQEIEKQGLNSGRLQSFNKISYNDSPVTEITSLEFQTGNDCNSACLICDARFSTTWQKYNKNKNIFAIEVDDSFAKVDVGLNSIRNLIDLTKLKNLGFVNGGEPLKSRIHIDIINEISKHTNLEKIELVYNTNGSYKPTEEIVNLWKKFKSVLIHVSVDGIDDHFNYLRWPLQWNQVKDNMKFMLELTDVNLTLGISYAVTPFSLFYHDRYVEWANDFFKPYKNTSISAYFKFPFRTGGVINMSCMPKSLANSITRKYFKYPAGIKIIKLIQDFDSVKYKEFMDYIMLHDTKRNNSFREVFPEIQHHFT